MKILILGAGHVHELLGYRECADVMREALADLARGRIEQPLRTIIRPRDKDTHQGGVLLFAAATGEPLAMVNASAITEIRTAATPARLPPRPGSHPAPAPTPGPICDSACNRLNAPSSRLGPAQCSIEPVKAGRGPSSAGNQRGL